MLPNCENVGVNHILFSTKNWFDIYNANTPEIEKMKSWYLFENMTPVRTSQTSIFDDFVDQIPKYIEIDIDQDCSNPSYAGLQRGGVCQFCHQYLENKDILYRLTLSICYEQRQNLDFPF